MNSMSTTTACFVLLFTIFLHHFAFASASASAIVTDSGYKQKQKQAEEDDNYIYYSRKMLLDLVGSSKTRVVDEAKMNDEVEMRNVPSGPDPLHHNGGGLKKPKITP